MSRNHGFVAAVAARLCPPRGLVLDFGCGDGSGVAAMRERGLAAFGADVQAQGWSPFRGLVAPGRVAAFAPDAPLPFADEAFAVVTANQVFEHVPEPARALAEIRRVLRPGGVLVALFPTREIWVEPHLRAPLVHRLPAAWQGPWMRAANALRRTDPDWARAQLGFLRERCFYRREAEWAALIARHGFSPDARLEGAWLADRIPAAASLPAPALRWLSLRLGGFAGVWQRAAQPAARSQAT